MLQLLCVPEERLLDAGYDNDNNVNDNDNVQDKHLWVGQVTQVPSMNERKFFCYLCRRQLLS